MENVYNASLLKTEAEMWEGWNDSSRDSERIPRGLPRGGFNILHQIYSKKTESWAHNLTLCSNDSHHPHEITQKAIKLAMLAARAINAGLAAWPHPFS